MLASSSPKAPSDRKGEGSRALPPRFLDLPRDFLSLRLFASLLFLLLLSFLLALLALGGPTMCLRLLKLSLLLSLFLRHVPLLLSFHLTLILYPLPFLASLPLLLFVDFLLSLRLSLLLVLLPHMLGLRLGPSLLELSLLLLSALCFPLSFVLLWLELFSLDLSLLRALVESLLLRPPFLGLSLLVCEFAILSGLSLLFRPFPAR